MAREAAGREAERMIEARGVARDALLELAPQSGCERFLALAASVEREAEAVEIAHPRQSEARLVGDEIISFTSVTSVTGVRSLPGRDAIVRAKFCPSPTARPRATASASTAAPPMRSARSTWTWA